MLEFDRPRRSFDLEWVERVSDLLKCDISLDSIGRVFASFGRFLLLFGFLWAGYALVSER